LRLQALVKIERREMRRVSVRRRNGTGGDRGGGGGIFSVISIQ